MAYIQECDRCYRPAVQKVVAKDYRGFIVYYCAAHKLVANLSSDYIYTDFPEPGTIADAKEELDALSGLSFSAVHTIRKVEAKLEKFIQNTFEELDASGIDTSELNVMVESLAKTIHNIDLVDEWEEYCDE